MRVGNVKEIVFSKDPKQMNWLREEFPYAEVKCPPEFSAEVQNEKDGDVLTTKIGFLQRCASVFYKCRKYWGFISVAGPLHGQCDLP